MSTQKNFRLSDRAVKGLKVISDYFDYSETEAIEYLINLYIENKCTSMEESFLAKEFVKEGLW